ncbi:MAG: PTS sugar transporter subunit IIA [Candidatus Omnitrophica bacterium]|nr:PTS sugar transporter subunit IIA [Candidatus Omnitrophota bacterium]
MANAVVQEKVDILTDLIDDDIEQGEIDRAEARLGGFLGVHCALARDGLVDKLFTTYPKHSTRKYLTNIGVSRRTGRYVHIDRADLIAYTPSVRLTPTGLNNVRDWFPYQDSPRLFEYLKADIIPLLRDAIYDRGKISELLQVIQVLHGVKAQNAPRAIAQCIRGSLDQARVTARHYKEILVVFDYDDRGGLGSIAVAPRGVEGQLPGGLPHDRLWLEAGRSPGEGFIRLDIFFDTETGKPADVTILPNLTKDHDAFQSQGVQIVNLTRSILHHLGCTSADMESIRSHQIEEMLGREDHGPTTSFADILRLLDLPLGATQSLNESAENAALAAI